MFGGLTFIVNTHMACGIVKDDLMVRVGKDGHVAALARGAHVMDFTRRPMRGTAIVSESQVVDESALDEGRDRRGVRAVTATQGEQEHLVHLVSLSRDGRHRSTHWLHGQSLA